MRILDLCSGAESIRRAVEELDLDYDVEVKSLDIESKNNPDFCADIRLWQHVAKSALGDWKPDLIWASPPCTQYSTLQNLNNCPLDRDFGEADSVVKACLSIIDALDPPFYVLENPGTGLLARRPFMRDRGDKVLVDYCMYGFLYRKRTALWTNVSFRARTCNKRCAGYDGSTHQDFRRYNNDVRISVPTELIRVILESVQAKRKRPPRYCQYIT